MKFDELKKGIILSDDVGNLQIIYINTSINGKNAEFIKIVINDEEYAISIYYCNFKKEFWNNSFLENSEEFKGYCEPLIIKLFRYRCEE